ncbi:hypothetical protein NP590_16805 [Methylomonas sp. SURF-2]|uniref:Uncharacterized protein n=1 Tax=Methylomonas subterranea TaxID=2952225 RepID=A0ABT1TJW7_9GAMM|nr:hypothetical protein [Methylomonas sp. SURF-2]MCQ8105772.1 hypothetical protein [Methylomonas sp. SURF-2]
MAVDISATAALRSGPADYLPGFQQIMRQPATQQPDADSASTGLDRGGIKTIGPELPLHFHNGLRWHFYC